MNLYPPRPGRVESGDEMNAFLKRNWVFLLLTLCAVAAAIGICVGRAQVERDNRTYDVVVDFKDLETMAYQSDTPIEEWLQLFHDQGVRSMALYEDTIITLSNMPSSGVSYAKVGYITTEPNWWKKYPQEVVDLIESSQDAYDVLVSVSDPELYQWILDAFQARTDPETFHATTLTIDSVGYVWIDGTYTRSGGNYADMSLGLLPSRVELLERFGFRIIPRTITTEHLNSAKYAQAVLDSFEPYQSPYFLNSGVGFLGFDEPEAARQMMLDYLDRTGAAVGVTEQMDQSQNVTWSGFDSFVMDNLESSAVRVFNEYGYIQNRWQYYGYSGSQEIVNSLFRAVVERNCRIVYLKMILKTDEDDIYITNPAAYEDMLSSLLTRLDEAGLTLGTAKALRVYSPAWYWRLLMGFGCVGGALVLLDLMLQLRRRWRVVLLVLGILGVCGAFYCAPNGVKLLLSIGAGILFPCLAGMGTYRVVQALRWKGKAGFGAILGRCICLCLGCCAVTLCGALVATAALSESAYMLEMKLYRGVKLMQLVPIGFLAVMFVLIFSVEDWGKRDSLLAWGRDMKARHATPEWRLDQRAAWDRTMEKTVSMRTLCSVGLGVLVVLCLGGAGAYYLMRTGNTSASVDVPTTELLLRNLLENLLIARPRTKEFLIGWPCLMLMVYALHHHNKLFSFLFCLGAAIGLTSVVNTFQHIRTPLYLSLLRTGYGLALGLVIGLAALVILELLRRLWLARRRVDA